MNKVFVLAGLLLLVALVNGYHYRRYDDYDYDYRPRRSRCLHRRRYEWDYTPNVLGAHTLDNKLGLKNCLGVNIASVNAWTGCVNLKLPSPVEKAKFTCSGFCNNAFYVAQGDAANCVAACTQVPGLRP
jgi:hypothetical protein